MIFRSKKKYNEDIEKHLTEAFKLFFEEAKSENNKCCQGNKLCTAYQIAHCNNIAESTFYDWINSGKIDYIRVDGIYYIKIKEFKKFLKERQ